MTARVKIDDMGHIRSKLTLPKATYIHCFCVKEMVYNPIWSSPPSSYRELVNLYEKQYSDSVAKGDYSPYVWPYRSLGVYLVILYLLIPPTSSKLVSYARYPVFAFNVYWAIKAIRECRSAAVSTGYGIGLLDAWAILWLAAVLIFDDGRSDFHRIEKAELVEGIDREGSGYAIHEDKDANGHELRRRCTDGSSAKNNIGAEEPTTTTKYFWQNHPANFYQRLEWVADLVSNFRLIGWSHQINTIPSPPPSVLDNLQPSAKPLMQTPPIVSTGATRYSDSKTLLRTKVATIMLGYLALDTLKVLMMSDPYFWGLTSASPPSYLPSFISSSAALTRIWRLLISLAGVYVALESIMALAAPIFVGLIGPRVLGLRAATWQYPDIYGSYGIVFRKGLAGWWGGWWHQTFRFAFEAPQKYFVKKLGWKERGLKAKLLGLVIAFVCSGSLHATGSTTMWPATQPLKGPFTFFILQPVGIVLQMGFSELLGKIGMRERLPSWVRGTGNFVAVHVWFYYTAPLLTDDFARGGIWLFEPIPISTWRGLGFGAEGEGWWCWNGRIVSWYSAEKWWQSGLAF
ncbi:hypothetical protein MMC32_002418 [Xylographa parallela]|nr:hypothetical protein [Xylographa parallela]